MVCPLVTVGPHGYMFSSPCHTAHILYNTTWCRRNFHTKTAHTPSLSLSLFPSLSFPLSLCRSCDIPLYDSVSHGNRRISCVACKLYKTKTFRAYTNATSFLTQTPLACEHTTTHTRTHMSRSSVRIEFLNAIHAHHDYVENVENDKQVTFTCTKTHTQTLAHPDRHR